MGANGKKRRLWGGLRIDGRESCAAAIKNGGVAAFICAAVNAAFGAAGFFTSSPDTALNYLLDPWLLVDAGLLAALGVFILRKSRIAATLAVAYFAVSKALMWAAAGPRGLLLSMILFVFFVNAMRGTYIWHSKYGSRPFNEVPGAAQPGPVR